jgi:hypothetical protein
MPASICMIVVTSQLVTVADTVPTFDSDRFGKNRGFNRNWSTSCGWRPNSIIDPYCDVCFRKSVTFCAVMFDPFPKRAVT